MLPAAGRAAYALALGAGTQAFTGAVRSAAGRRDVNQRAAEPGIGFTLRVAGRLDARWAARFDGCTLTPEEDGTTTLCGTVSDQSELHGVLNGLRDLAIPLISLQTGSDDG